MSDTPRFPDGRDAGDTGADPTRREFVRSAGVAGTVLMTGDVSVDRPDRSVTAADESDGDCLPDAADGDEADGRDDFLWVHRGTWLDDRERTNAYAFARRHDLAVVIPVSAAGLGDREAPFRRALSHAARAGLDVWLRTGVLNDLTAEQFVEDDEARETHLEGLREVCRIYEQETEDGTVILWEEAPVMGEWVPGGEWNSEAAANLLEYGPRVFAEQSRAVADAVVERPVGIFVHFPYVVDSKSPETFATLIDRLADRDAVPDFAFLDFYRGWYEKDVGPERADAAVRSLVENASLELGGRPVYYLAQAHTINPNHTPSKDAMLSNLRASIDAGAAGLGWYERSGYVPTERGFDPFVPNVPDANVSGDVMTGRVARDRFLFAWLATFATRETFAPADRFDLWLWADDLAYRDHRVSVRDCDGWTFLRDVDSYLDGEYPYARGDDGEGDVAVLRGLRRDRWLDGNLLELRIDTAGDAAGSTFRAALAMPCEPDAYVTEPEAASLLAGDDPVEEYALGSVRDSLPLSPGTTLRMAVPVRTRDAPSLHGLAHPGFADDLRRLRSFAARDGVDLGDWFDLWVRAEGLSDPAAAPSLVDRQGVARPPAEESVVALADEGVGLYYGLPRARFLADGLALAADDVDGSVTAYAMPAAGSAAFRTPARAAAVLAEHPGEVETFSLATAGTQ